MIILKIDSKLFETIMKRLLYVVFIFIFMEVIYVVINFSDISKDEKLGHLITIMFYIMTLSIALIKEMCKSS